MPAPNAVNPTDSASAIDFEFPAPGSGGYDEFRKSGKIPEAKPAETEAIEHKEPESSEAAESATAKPVVTRPESATGTPQGKKDAASRLKEVLEDRKRDRELIRQLTEKLSAPASVKPTSQPTSELEKKDAKAKPKLGDNDPKTGKPFTSLEAWSDAVDEWNTERFNQELETRLSKAEQTHQQTAQQQRANEELGAKLAVGKTKYPDFEKVAFNPELTIPVGSAVDVFVRNSDNAAEIMYYLGQHPDILNSFYRYEPGKDDMPGKLTGMFHQLIHPTLQMMELAKIEARLAAEVAPVKTPARTITQAPRPPHQVSGKAPTPDPLAKAVEEGDQAEFTRLENERILAKRKAVGGRR